MMTVEKGDKVCMADNYFDGLPANSIGQALLNRIGTVTEVLFEGATDNKGNQVFEIDFGIPCRISKRQVEATWIFRTNQILNLTKETK